MQRRPSVRNRYRSRRQAEGGYVLIWLMFLVTLMAILSIKAFQELKFEVQRDREEELVHRGVQYSRAVRKYYKKFGTYPATLDALENTQNLRFLRKRYKDPLNRDANGKEQDFKILKMTDVRGLIAPGIAGVQALGANAAGLAGALGQNGAMGQNGALAQNGAQVAAMVANQAVAQASNTGNPFSNLNSGNAGSHADQGDGTAANPNTPGGGNNPGNGQSADGTNNTNSSPFVTASGKPTDGAFGGAPIVGVASASKKETIRIFAKKNHYNDWQFVYDPNSDRGGLLNAPVQPGLQQSLGTPTQGGQPGNPAGPNSASPFSNGPGVNPPGPGTPTSGGGDNQQQ